MSLTASTKPLAEGQTCPVQYGALCWRMHRGKVEVLLIASRDTGQNSEAAKTLYEMLLPLRAPVILAVISSPNHHDPKKTPVWEQQLSSGALCQNLLIAANAMGWAAVWITEDAAFDSHVHAALGMTGHEQVAGFIYIGTAKDVQDRKSVV